MVIYHRLMPIHDLEDVRFLIEEDAWVLATTRCRRKVEALGLTRAQVRAMLLSLTPQDHRKEYGPADTDFGQIEADDYILTFEGDCYYIKLGIHGNDEGDSCLVASFHLDGAP